MRTELERRPLFVAAIGLTLGLAIPQAWPLLVPWIAAFLVLRPASCRLWLALAGLAGLWLAPEIPSTGLNAPKYIESVATVGFQSRVHEGKRSCQLNFGFIKLYGTYPASLSLEMGDRIAVKGVAQPLAEGMDVWALLEGMVGKISLDADQVQVVSHPSYPYQMAVKWRLSLIDLASRNLDPDDASLVSAICFGQSESLSDARVEALKATGTVHLIAASGLHVLILGSILLGVLGLLPIPRPVSLVLFVGFLFMYVCAAGFHVGTIRAAIMTTAGASAYLLRRESDAISSLSLAAIAILLTDPFSVYDLAFYFTFVAVLALILFGWRGNENSGSKRMASTFRTAIVATLAVTPLTMIAFGYVSVVSVLANVVVLIVFVPIIVLGIAATLVSPASAWLCDILMHAAGTCARGLGWMVDGMGSYSWATVSTADFSPYWLIAFYAIPLLFWRKKLREA